MSNIDPVIPILGTSLIAAFIVGKISHRLKIPKVTGFICIGLLMGPSLLNHIDEDIHHKLNYISELALGLILFNIGGEFHKELLTKIGWKMVKFSLLYCTLVFLFVMSVSALIMFVMGFSFSETSFFAIFTGIIALTAAPPTTLLVIKEYDSKGSLTDYIIVILAISTILAIIGSEIAMILFQKLDILPDTGGSLSLRSLMLLWQILGSILVGVFLGFAISFLEQLEKSSSEILLAISCAILLGLTLSHYLKLEPMLVSFFIGFSLVNFSHAGEDLHHHLKSVGLSMYALFFILAGAHIDIYQLQSIGLFGVIYIVCRCSGITFAAILSCKFFKEKSIKGHWLGLSLFSHAGAALGIVAKFGGTNVPIIANTVNTIVSSVFFFEIIGPMLLRYSLLKSREIKVANLIGDASTGIVLSLPQMLKNFLRNLGIFKTPDLQEISTITPLIQRKIYAIQAKADFSKVIKYIDEHHFPIYPVVDEDNIYQGLIDLAELKNAMFDGFLSRFVLASDLIGEKLFLTENASIEEANIKFKSCSLDALPVIDEETNKLIGLMIHKDVIMALHK